ncbi:two-component system, OmpR family, sensor kinase [Actinomyces ruminicola]|uniref:histidine kinase n=1 Tax=Actinomyces ruminicola TaxID=332524 RepID=A0A1H0B4K2_9ACTO|nr:HAMP domain-containing sensor histidine kinase [Actinomyces ruminicola]SDN40532.1 two-component system, OmpR family, sensor kinase [Actinomyces ruminicola]
MVRITPRSLRTRLVVGVIGIVLVMAAGIGALSTLMLRHSLMDRLDEQLTAASERAAARRQGAAPAGSDTGKAQGNDPSAQPPGDGATPPTGTSGDVPLGLDAVGQSTGTLTVIASGARGEDGSFSATSMIKAGYIDDDGTYRTLTDAECAVLLSLEVTGEPVTVSVDSLGNYRVLVTEDSTSGDIVVTGLSTTGDEKLIRTQLLAQLLIAIIGALSAALAGGTMVRAALAPLERVADTAERVASQPLARGEVSIRERVDAADVASSQEIGQVGNALNTLLGHVDEALTARQRSETQVRQFVADASHELRTPLASIRGYTELIQRSGADAVLPEDSVHALERVHSESVRMTALVEDLLLLARLDAGRELEHAEVDLVEIVVDAVSDARAAGPDHVWELNLEVLEPPAQLSPEAAAEFIPEPTLVVGDEARLRQVMVNLLANARVHTPAGSRVTTTLSRGDAGTLVIRVADDGPGIAPAVRERLFERFARADASRERRTGSTGLGMSIALAIVQSHHGSLTVESHTDADNHGTTFTVTLPTAPPPEDAACGGRPKERCSHGPHICPRVSGTCPE